MSESASRNSIAKWANELWVIANREMASNGAKLKTVTDIRAVAEAMESYATATVSEQQALFRTRVGDSLEVLDAIREALSDQDKERIVELVNGYIDRASADLERLK